MTTKQYYVKEATADYGDAFTRIPHFSSLDAAMAEARTSSTECIGDWDVCEVAHGQIVATFRDGTPLPEFHIGDKVAA